MEMLFSFIAGMVLAGIVAAIALRNVKSSAAEAQTKALEDAAKQATAAQIAATSFIPGLYQTMCGL